MSNKGKSKKIEPRINLFTIAVQNVTRRRLFDETAESSDVTISSAQNDDDNPRRIKNPRLAKNL